MAAADQATADVVGYRLSAINLTPMSNHADNNLSRRLVREVEDSIISNPDAPAIAILEFLATGRKGSFSSERSMRAIRLCTVPGSWASSFFASRASSTRQLTPEFASL